MTPETLIEQVRQWLAENWKADSLDAEDAKLAWRRKVHAAGYAAPSWPQEAGGLGVSPDTSKLIEREFALVGAPGSGQDRTNIAANTVQQFGTPKAKAELLDGLVTNASIICLLYSEPGAGSDLASVRAKAALEGDHYKVTGQKVWTSRAADADYGLLLARTDWDVPKHAGLSFFIMPMKQAGIEIRPIHQINGESHFNEVFMDEALVPADYLLSREGDGWKVMNAALIYERVIMAEGATERSASSRSQPANLVELARRYGRLSDPLIRQEVAQAIAWRKLNELNAARAKKIAAEGGTSPLMSLGKLAMSRVLHNDARVMRLIMGSAALLDGADQIDAQDANFRGLHAYMNSIGGGTDQIQRNIIAERILGLPREIEPDREIPFKASLAMKAGQA